MSENAINPLFTETVEYQLVRYFQQDETPPPYD